jgi:hypothetical protein
VIGQLTEDASAAADSGQGYVAAVNPTSAPKQVAFSGA